MWMGIVADCVTSAIFLTAMAPNLLLIGLMKSASHATLSWGDWFLGMLPLSIFTGPAGSTGWLTCCTRLY